MKSIILQTAFVFAFLPLAFGHEGGHHVPSTYSGATVSIGNGNFGVSASQTADGQIQITLKDLEGDFEVDPLKSGFAKDATADIVLKGGKKFPGTKLSLSGKIFRGKLKARGKIDRVMKVYFNHDKAGKIFTAKAIEEVPLL